ncbi:MAG: sporulation protein YunB [Defluviitaleaceae bacterium]|nr:sporulation protein YunB [Defluviitaleaceae bacterium]
MKRKFWPRRKKIKGKTGGIPRRYLFFLMLLATIAAFAYSFYRFDRRILPMVLEAAELRIQAEINHVINDVIQEIIWERQLNAADFIVHGQGAVLSVNTVLVNDICNAAAQRISERLNNLEPERVQVPMGMAFGLDTLAQVGPRFSFDLAPIGNALVNYESSFAAVGINQIHFAVWLTVESVVRIINPVHSSEIVVTRHVSLVDTVISGTVPDTFVNMDVPGFIAP